MTWQGKDLQELRRFIYANSLDRHVLRKLLHKIMPDQCNCPTNSDAPDGGAGGGGGGRCSGHEVALPIQATVQELDLPEENIATLLCHLESHPAKWVLEVITL